MAVGKRYFEFSEGTSNKFWEVWTEGSQVFTRYGKIGASGQVTLKDEGSEAGAQKLYEKLVKEKTGKGYAEKGAAGAAAAPAPAAAAAAAKKPAAKVEEPRAEPPPAPAKKAVVAAPAPAPAAAGGTRRFEFTEDGSSKFWEITVDGSAHTVRYGKIGTPGQEKSKSFGSPAAAQGDAEKLVREKTGKGYAEVAGAGGGGGPEAPPLDPKELAGHLSSIDQKPGAPDAYLVFADWLESKGHPWGKLIALQHAIATAPNAKKKAELQREETVLLQSNGHAILGDLARAGRPTRFEWQYGFITHAVIASPTHALVLKERLKTLFSLPAGRALTRLTLHAEPTRMNSHQEGEESVNDVINPWDGVPAVLAEAPSSLTHVAFGEAPPSGAAAYVALPNLGQVAKALPAITHLEVQGAGGGAQHGLARGINFPQLTSLDVRLASANAADLEAIAEAKLPKVESLLVSTGGNAYTDLDSAGYDPYDNEDGDARYPDTYPASDLEKMEIYDVNPEVNSAAVGQWVSKLTFPSLTRLAVHTQLRPDFITALANAPVLKKLTVLDLSGTPLRAEAVEALVANKAKFAHLEALHLRLGDAGDTAEKLKKAIPGVKPATAKAEGDGFIFRFVATME